MAQATLSSHNLDDQSPRVRTRSVAGRVRPIVWWTLGLLGLVGGSIAVWEQALEDRLIAKRFGTVEPNLIYRSGQISKFLIGPTLENHNIDVVIDLTEMQPDHPDQIAEQEAIRRLGLEAHRFPLIGDGTGDVTNYVAAITTMHRAAEENRPVLVHCAAGAQRTGGTIAFYRLLVQGWSSEDVLIELESYDWNRRKDAVMLDYMNEHMAIVAEGLRENGVIATVPQPLPQLRP